MILGLPQEQRLLWALPHCGLVAGEAELGRGLLHLRPLLLLLGEEGLAGEALAQYLHRASLADLPLRRLLLVRLGLPRAEHRPPRSDRPVPG